MSGLVCSVQNSMSGHALVQSKGCDDFIERIGASAAAGTVRRRRDLTETGTNVSVDTRTMQLMLTEADRPGDVLLWINGKLKFGQATLVEIVQCLEKHFDVHFIISDAQLKKERFTCTFSTDDDIRQILSILALTKRFDYKCEDNNIILTPKAGR